MLYLISILLGWVRGVTGFKYSFLLFLGVVSVLTYVSAFYLTCHPCEFSWAVNVGLLSLLALLLLVAHLFTV